MRLITFCNTLTCDVQGGLRAEWRCRIGGNGARHDGEQDAGGGCVAVVRDRCRGVGELEEVGRGVSANDLVPTQLRWLGRYYGVWGA